MNIFSQFLDAFLSTFHSVIEFIGLSFELLKPFYPFFIILLIASFIIPVYRYFKDSKSKESSDEERDC